ncbi:MAG: hypothetical protein HUU37_08115 [Bdellovibrionales bacterium]|nr:hypothetical protein [Bdellovibrionales bacterium]
MKNLLLPLLLLTWATPSQADIRSDLIRSGEAAVERLPEGSTLELYKGTSKHPEGPGASQECHALIGREGDKIRHFTLHGGSKVSRGVMAGLAVNIAGAFGDARDLIEQNQRFAEQPNLFELGEIPANTTEETTNPQQRKSHIVSALREAGFGAGQSIAVGGKTYRIDPSSLIHQSNLRLSYDKGSFFERYTKFTLSIESEMGLEIANRSVKATHDKDGTVTSVILQQTAGTGMGLNMTLTSECTGLALVKKFSRRPPAPRSQSAAKASEEASAEPAADDAR